MTISRTVLAEAVLCTISDAIVAADERGIIQAWNPGAERIFGYTSGIIIPEQLRARHWLGYRQVMATGESRYGHGDILAVPGIRKDGERISLEFTIVPLRDEAGQVIGMAAIMRDVTIRFDHTPSTGEPMARKANKTKSKRGSTAKFKAKRSGSKPLMAKVASVRTAKSTTSMSRGSNGKSTTSPLNPALSGSKPLMAKAASVRTAKPTTSMSRGSNGKPPASPLNPALSGIKPLMAEADSPTTSIGRASNGKPPTSPLNPALSGSKPLMAEAALVRAAPSTSMSRASNGEPPTFPLNPALTVMAMMGRVMGAYAEFPARLAQCRTPMDIWSEQARFVQRVFSASPVSADRPLRAQSQ
jgi:PAS domain S-box-containing protein